MPPEMGLIIINKVGNVHMIFKHRIRLKTLHTLYNVTVSIFAYTLQKNVASSQLKRK